MLVAYFPPKLLQQKEWKAYQRTCEAICEWLIETLSLIPTRCTPFVATDLNTQLGIEAGRHEPRWTPEVGTRGASIEDETATMFRSVLKQHRLIAINTHFDDRYTFYNSSGSGGSLIDFVCTPQELFEAVSHAGICEGAGRRLQLVNVCRLFDHVPVQVSLSYSLDHSGFSQEAEERLNRDQLRKCITHGEKRVELVHAVARELESLSEEMDGQLREKTPDAIVTTFTSALMKAAKAVFGIMQGDALPRRKQRQNSWLRIYGKEGRCGSGFMGALRARTWHSQWRLCVCRGSSVAWPEYRSSKGGDFWKRSWRTRGGRVCGTTLERLPGFSVAKD